MSRTRDPRPDSDLSVSAVLAAFLKLGKSEQEVVREQVKSAADPLATEEQRRQAEEAVRATLERAEGQTTAARVLNKEERLSAAHLAWRERNDQAEKEFAERLARMMAERCLTQAELARRIGVGQSAVSMLLSRKCRPQPRTLGKIAEALGVAVEELWPGKLSLRSSP